MIERSKSFSKGGAIIQRVMEIDKYKIDKEDLNKLLRARYSKIAGSKDGRKEAVTGRDTPNSFLRHTVKDAYTNLDYQPKKDEVLVRPANFSIRQQKDERLSQLLIVANKQQRQPERSSSCRRLSACNNEHIRTANDLLSARKTFHSIDFQKQTNRPFDDTLKRLSTNVEMKIALTRSNSLGTINSQQNIKDQIQMIKKKNKAHAFESYTKRDFLSEKKVKGAPEVSGIDSFKINPQKFKGQWKVVNPLKFDSMAKKHLNRYDRDCPHWFTQLNYNVKNNQRSVKSHLDFQSQTDRKLNEVKSSYPIRLAI